MGRGIASVGVDLFGDLFIGLFGELFRAFLEAGFGVYFRLGHQIRIFGEFARSGELQFGGESFRLG
jgi:hypothetical protein